MEDGERTNSEVKLINRSCIVVYVYQEKKNFQNKKGIELKYRTFAVISTRLSSYIENLFLKGPARVDFVPKVSYCLFLLDY